MKLTLPVPAGIVSGEAGVNLPAAEVVLKIDRQRTARIDSVAERVFQRDRDRAGGDARSESLRRRGERHWLAAAGLPFLCADRGEATGRNRKRRRPAAVSVYLKLTVPCPPEWSPAKRE